ncbi:IPT/TIG domain-containing protein [Streptomyces sp. BR123]|nr:IPT/TIG domain-containing protein [Streptomyces sp. BR123]
MAPQPPTPTVLGITPPSGPTTGGTPFTIVGTNLTGASVTFGGVPATNVNVIGGVLLTGLTPPGAAGNVAVQVTTPFGSVNVAGGFTYTAPPAPIATSIIPTTGPVLGGTPFVIVGANLTGASVTFGGVAATNVVVDASGTFLSGLTPPGAAGNVAVQVTTPFGSVNVAGGFTYTALAAPIVASITPVVGPVIGGTPFVIVGANLTGASVTFGGVAATNVVVDASGTVLAGLTPAGAVGNVAVVVTTPSGSANVAGGFTYE